VAAPASKHNVEEGAATEGRLYNDFNETFMSSVEADFNEWRAKADSQSLF